MIAFCRATCLILLRIFCYFVFIATFLSACASYPLVSGVPLAEDKFDQIKLGMSKGEVRVLLGEPYHQYHYATGETWVWTYLVDNYAESVALVFVKDKVAEASLYNEALRDKAKI